MNTQAGWIFGTALMAVAVVWSRGEANGALSGLGDDPSPPASPSGSNKSEYLRTHIAKKFWGTAVLGAQASESLTKLSGRVRSFSPEASQTAAELAGQMHDIHMRALATAQKYNEPWVRLRIQSGTWPGAKQAA